MLRILLQVEHGWIQVQFQLGEVETQEENDDAHHLRHGDEHLLADWRVDFLGRWRFQEKPIKYIHSYFSYFELDPLLLVYEFKKKSISNKTNS